MHSSANFCMLSPMVAVHGGAKGSKSWNVARKGEHGKGPAGVRNLVVTEIHRKN